MWIVKPDQTINIVAVIHWLEEKYCYCSNRKEITQGKGKSLAKKLLTQLHSN